VESAHATNEFVAGAEIEMVGVAENDFGTQRFERILRNGLNGALCADGHENGSFDGLMRKMKAAAAPAGGVCVEELEVKAH
jgi:hypothetical protein